MLEYCIAEGGVEEYNLQIWNDKKTHTFYEFTKLPCIHDSFRLLSIVIPSQLCAQRRLSLSKIGLTPEPRLPRRSSISSQSLRFLFDWAFQI
ncbi:hypothetical protein Nepgr_005610 [Nepenthes gracilis]|uniref:Uncharacterized protein n=1 Tax=Nepenthes gracilis TaxID=150966 RepID=A0AAD3S3U6_NEPGR|nr:hypothetical protein Nepgr_005610 [Nepenthes gracilis]